MRRKVSPLLIAGLVALGAMVGMTQVDVPCAMCGGDGKIDCPVCLGSGVDILMYPLECGCRGGDPACPICQGSGYYLGFTTQPCPECQGKGGDVCPRCQGKGSLTLLRRYSPFFTR